MIDPTTAAVQEVIRSTYRFGFTWQLRAGTVRKSMRAADPTPVVLVSFDGDDVAVTVTSLVGPLALGARVAVAFVPPSGNYVVGFITGVPGQYVDHQSSTAATIASNTGAAAAIFTTNPIFMLPHSVYEVSWRGRQSCAGGLGPSYFLNKDSTAGALIYDWGVYHISLVNFDLPVFGHCYVANTKDTFTKATMCLNFNGGTGGQPVSFKAGNANKVAWMNVRYRGPFEDFPEAVQAY